jgi:FMN reductase
MILIFSSSLKPDSRSRILAREAQRVLLEQKRTVEFVDLRDHPLPLCDGGAAYGHPAVAPLGQLVASARAIIVATPIYNYAGNAAVKNLIELTGKHWEDKPVAFLCAAGGMGSYMAIMGLANSLMLDYRCLIVPRFVYATGQAFAEGQITDAEVAGRVARMVRETLRIADSHFAE